MHKLEKIVRDANNQGRPAIVPFLTAGFPEKEKFWDALSELDKYADIIEIGIPFSDPVADGPMVENASRQSLAAGFNLREFMAELPKREKLHSGLVLMGYLNPFLQYGIDELARDAASAGVNGLIIPDLPYEESEKTRKTLSARGLALIPLVGPNTSRERMELYARDAEGYAYVVSVMGVTGERKSLSDSISDVLMLAKDVFSVPVALGFGLKHPSQLAELPKKARPDAAIFGSALLAHISSGGKAGDFLMPWLKTTC